MACSANQLLVSGVISYPNANGVYTALDPVVYADLISGYNALKLWQRISGSEGFLIYQLESLAPNSWAIEVYTNLPEGTTNIYNPDGNYSDPQISFVDDAAMGNPAGQDVCPEFVTWTNGVTVTSYSGAPSQNTFGLPADVVALITSRFGSVANFLRLRNQGQV